MHTNGSLKSEDMKKDEKITEENIRSRKTKYRKEDKDEMTKKSSIPKTEER